MAEEKNQNTSSVNTGPLLKGMIKDTDDSYSPQGSWFHMRNGMPNSRDGNLGTVCNEPSNLHCVTIPYTIIGCIHMYKDVWAIFSTDDVNSEIGTFDEGQCLYTPLQNCTGQNMNPVNCLGFKRTNLIKGVAKENFDCTWQVYFADSLNPDRTVNMNKPAFIENCVTVNNCQICTCTTALDCDLLRLSPLVTVPCVTVTRGPNGGSILNGSYYAVIAYVLNGQRVTDYYMPSNTQAIFEHDNVSGSLLITINQMDTAHFDYFELVIVRTVNSQTSAKKIGVYSTREAQISLDTINEALESVPVEFIPLRSPNYEISDGIFETGQYMLRTGPRAKFDFNYQPLANQITAKWQTIEYPSDYYSKGGVNTGYMGDEVYPFFLRWIYNTGEKTASYHIPGRPSLATDLAPIPVLDQLDPSEQRWEVVNTAAVTASSMAATGLGVLPDGGIIRAEGIMGYWQSSESYPDKKPEIFNSSAHPFSSINTGPLNLPIPYPGTTVLQYDLCGNPIRHHKFPSNDTDTGANHLTNHFRKDSAGLLKVLVKAVKFDNILPPVDNQGNLIPGIVGYEILRGSREGNKTVIAKGIINNMRTYALDDNSGRTGLYQNYPYNPLGTDESVSTVETVGGTNSAGAGTPATSVSTNQFTFHSPDTQFNNPFLSAKELKIYGEVSGQVIGNFDEVPGHPKHKLLTNISFIVSAVVGIGAAMVALRGKTLNRRTYPSIYNQGLFGTFATGSGTVGAVSAIPGYLPTATIWNALNLATNPTRLAYNNALNQGATLPADLAGTNPATLTSYTTASKNASNILAGIIGYQDITDQEMSQHRNIPFVLRVANGASTFSNYWTMGTQAALDLIRAVVPFTQYAYRYTSHGLSDVYQIPAGIKKRHQLTNAIYLSDGMQDFGENSNAVINNTYRSKCVALQTLVGVANPSSAVDNTVQTIRSAVNAGLLPNSFQKNSVKKSFPTTTVSHYTALKQRMRNQYGQLDAIIQVPASYCEVLVNQPMVPGTIVSGTPTIFNGDIYIGHYTEKNTFFYFWEWLYNQPDGFEFDYRLRYMLNFPRYWADFTEFDPSDFIRTFVNAVVNIPPNFSAIGSSFPSGRARLDGPLVNLNSWADIVSAAGSIFRMTNRYFYIFQSGVRDFFVESEINVGMRDWEDTQEGRYYDTGRYTDLRSLFDPKIIKTGNKFKYDQSLSISRIFNNFFSWGNIQQPDYNPQVAETCYTYYPNRMIYSLPQQLEARKDFWRVFLANNYKDFKSRVTAVRPVNKTGAMIFFQTESPAMFQGVDELQTELGVKITVGDGGLFRREPQNIVNTDASYEYGSCQDRLSVVNTKYGLYWISQNQGKIFSYAGGLSEISKEGLWFWLSTYLPYKLTEDFPTFQLTDNPVIGIGCQTIYDNQEDTVYFCKRDYKIKPQYLGQVTYVGADNFLLGTLPIKLGNLQYFDDASWTLSYDPKDKYWVSYHDWHPDLTLPGKNEFLSTVHDPVTNVGSIWRHNTRTDSFCNFYGIDYPFEIDRIAQTGPNVTTLRSIEYYMEAYIYRQPNEDIYEVLDANFDHATIYNREQVSGTLILNQMPKNSVAQRLLFPKINPTSIDILADKVEQKYRFNQFWDITADRGEFTFPNVQRPIWNTHINGYIRDLNPANLNYQKNAFQRKKFRHYANHVRLYKNISGNINYVVKLINAKELVSLR